MSQPAQRGKPRAKDPGFTLIEARRPDEERIAEAILYLLTRRAQRLAGAAEAPGEDYSNKSEDLCRTSEDLHGEQRRTISGPHKDPMQYEGDKHGEG
jgi:hypothetical protein